ncbi:hypothetical protein CEP52_004600 [Fusarium oligoseptatum]|uniref:Uncharacterized protein n=1 Tax=Fusarium oligoseptatum TaxID=2604345 RepID=A0A428U2T2_9HYPO|nr:hypothetical protein CEP52_004600 [Fusarium oligoseptatum]
MSDKEILLDFENFWEDQGTWERLHSLKIVLRRAEDYGTQKINNICESWLQHNYNARTMLRAWLLADEDRRLGTETLEELKAWDMATEELSEALQWTMWFRWPCGRLPWVQDSNLKRPVSEKRKAPTVNNDNEDGEVRDSPNSKRRNLGAEQPSLVFEDLSGVLARDRYVHVEDTKPEDAKPEHAKVKGGEANDSPHDQGGNPDSVIEKNFEDVQARFNQFEAGKEYWAFDWQMLQRFSDEWAETIWSLPQFLAVKDELNLEMDRLFQLEESCLKRGAWRNENMQICPAETITLV